MSYPQNPPYPQNPQYPPGEGYHQGQGQPITMQPIQPYQPGMPAGPGGPMGPGWMAMPHAPPPNCPPGLEYLSQIDQLLVKQKMEILEAFSGFETNNKYEILNSIGQRVYYAAEETNFCVRNCCGARRPFHMRIMDNTCQQVIRLNRAFRCESCFCFCCLQKVEVEAPPGNIVGYIRQQCSPCYPRFTIRNAQDETVLKISGPCCTWSMCGDVEFDVLTGDGSSRVGRITKQWSGLGKEYFTDADNFGISFPMDLDVNMKAVMLGAVFLIDFMFFEVGPKSKKKIKH
ncbi:phospholipid scramblase 1-like [Liolophura sinensis]|uniref:phospholipid scramblase 1-like n=1 Tax=Liolophura sinensis TaxID=3198878 RepID=UPI0031580951